MKFDLKSVLTRSSDAFISWRYLYEGGALGDFTYYCFEYQLLDNICEIIRSLVVHLLTIHKRQRAEAARKPGQEVQ